MATFIYFLRNAIIMRQNSQSPTVTRGNIGMREKEFEKGRKTEPSAIFVSSQAPPPPPPTTTSAAAAPPPLAFTCRFTGLARYPNRFFDSNLKFPRLEPTPEPRDRRRDAGVPGFSAQIAGYERG